MEGLRREKAERRRGREPDRSDRRWETVRCREEDERGKRDRRGKASETQSGKRCEKKRDLDKETDRNFQRNRPSRRSPEKKAESLQPCRFSFGFSLCLCCEASGLGLAPHQADQ